ncbi:hypothetical protein [Sorangium sp. So ce513]|uniref:hypothetical protein n=1 Tax=Sorangium sp. So ce513 TaxID=3133315 RepID=UPI003F5E6A7C
MTSTTRSGEAALPQLEKAERLDGMALVFGHLQARGQGLGSSTSVGHLNLGRLRQHASTQTQVTQRRPACSKRAGVADCVFRADVTADSDST